MLVPTPLNSGIYVLVMWCGPCWLHCPHDLITFVHKFSHMTKLICEPLYHCVMASSFFCSACMCSGKAKSRGKSTLARQDEPEPGMWSSTSWSNHVTEYGIHYSVELHAIARINKLPRVCNYAYRDYRVPGGENSHHVFKVRFALRTQEEHKRK